MATLAKAFLVELLGNTKDSKPNPKRDPIPVQFNPTSLHLQMTNNEEGGKSRQRQAEQSTGAATTTLSLDLVFDSADEGSAATPSDVRIKVKEVETFVLPSPGSKDPPPRVRFQWGTFLYEGIMASLNEDIDLFSVEGVPLRAKVSIQIKGQDPKFAALQTAQGANQTLGDSPTAAGLGAGPGSSGGGPTNRTGTAIGGESAADFAARMGLDPAAWRGLAAGLDGTLSLQAGLQINFNASLSATVGVGVTAGTESGASASIVGSLGLDASAVADLGPVAAAATSPAPSVAAGAAAGAGSTGATAGVGGVGSVATPGTLSTGGSGFALSAAGGLAAAVETAKSAATQAVAAQERSAFGIPPAPPAAAAPAVSGARTPGVVAPAPPGAGSGMLRGCTPLVSGAPATLPDQSRTPLRLQASLATGGQAPSAPSPPAADPRATSFGLGVPLRPALTGAAGQRRAGVGGGLVVGPRPPAPVPLTGHAGTSPWRRLPSGEPGRPVAEQAQRVMSLRRQQGM
jgi:Contractile injection system tube protein